MIWTNSWIKWTLRFCSDWGGGCLMASTRPQQWDWCLPSTTFRQSVLRQICSVMSGNTQSFIFWCLFTKLTWENTMKQMPIIRQGISHIRGKSLRLLTKPFHKEGGWIEDLQRKFTSVKEVSQGTLIKKIKLQSMLCPNLSSHVLHLTMKSFQRKKKNQIQEQGKYTELGLPSCVSFAT